jgi:hypothetical protein
MKIAASPPAPFVHRRPWLPTSFGFALFLVLVLAWQFRAAGPRKAEPSPSGSAWAIDPEATASLEGFLEDRRAAAPSQNDNRQFQRGIALGLYSQSPGYDYSGLLDEIADHNASRVSFFFNMYQEGKTSTAMDPLMSPAEQEAKVLRAVRQAHERGLEVMAFPLVLLSQPGKREWRGNIEPADVDLWFENYGAHLVRLARLMERHGGEAICIGSEFSSLEKYEGRWRELIAKVREVFTGEVIYSANWDHYEHVGFWDGVDAIGLSGYYELTRSKDPSLEELTASWTRIRDRILEWRAGVEGAPPIVFTEIGYANLDGTNVYPWDYTMQGEPDPAEQALCYEAFMRAWDGRPELEGVYFYNWFGFDTLEDTGYSPRGKPAAQLIRLWYGDLAARPGESARP